MKKSRLNSIFLVFSLGAVVSFQSVRRTEITILNFCVYFFTSPHTICVRLPLFKEYKRERENFRIKYVSLCVRERAVVSFQNTTLDPTLSYSYHHQTFQQFLFGICILCALMLRFTTRQNTTVRTSVGHFLNYRLNTRIRTDLCMD